MVERKEIIYNQDLPQIEFSRKTLASNGAELETEYYLVKAKTLKACESTLKRIRK